MSRRLQLFAARMHRGYNQYMSTAAMQGDKTYYEVPAGHVNSDLSSTACNIGLGRRRDLTLRQDVRVRHQDEQKRLTEVLQGKLAVLFGLPEVDSATTSQHVSGFLKKLSDLRAAGVDSVYCVTATDASSASSWATKAGLTGKVELINDDSGAFSRLLGVELEGPTPATQRYAALVENGILLKLAVEKTPEEVQVSSADKVLQIITDLKH